ncbi:hypothetical protein SESBI_12595 [Sesbania bispinosa]|nr:hypothetical protein SESBI_12595 [Sesbania bispinosa]
MRIPNNRGLRRITLSASNYHLKSHISTCRAVLLPSFGGPEKLELHSNVQIPPLKPDQYLSTLMRSGYGRSIFEPLLPLILGRDVSEVAAVGGSVRSVSVANKFLGIASNCSEGHLY